MQRLVGAVLHLRVDQGAGRVTNFNQSANAALAGFAGFDRRHDGVLTEIKAIIHQRIAEIPHIRVGWKRSLCIYILFGRNLKYGDFRANIAERIPQ